MGSAANFENWIKSHSANKYAKFAKIYAIADDECIGFLVSESRTDNFRNTEWITINGIICHTRSFREGFFVYSAYLDLNFYQKKATLRDNVVNEDIRGQ